MYDLLNNIFPGFLDGQTFLRITVRLAVAMILGGTIGFERQFEGKSAGIRTHMMVSLGAALFALTSLESSADPKELTKVIQGVATGVGFLGVGAIIKVSNENTPKGLTTAGGIWMTAAVGLATGAGLLWTAVIGVILALIVLGVIHVIERWWRHYRKHHGRHCNGQIVSAAPPPPPPGMD